jgi:CheY-like chemotaxis protein
MKQVMIVDDDRGIRRSTTKLLELEGYRVVAETSGEACLARLREGFRGIILMDIDMPGLSGWETIRRMVADGLYHNVLICMLTMMESPGVEGEGLQEYVFDYLPKPFNNADLVILIENAVSFLEG